MLEVHIEKIMPGFLLKASFSCHDSRLLALTGSSGAGKTTLVRIIAGLEKADKGKITYRDTVWYDSENSIFLKPQARQVGYVFQEHTLFPHMTVEENISFIAHDRRRTAELMTLFQIRHIAKRKPHMVSGGERQRAAFAQALAKNPRVLLLDEPFSALDPETRKLLQKRLLDLKDSMSLPVIHVTHDMSEADFLADSSLNIEREFSNNSELESSFGRCCGKKSVFRNIYSLCRDAFQLPFNRRREAGNEKI